MDAMGPATIFDKSAVEALGRDALSLHSSNFYTTITPILLWEICGDIEKARRGQCDESKVRSLAAKARPFDSITTTDWRKVCLPELLGYRLDLQGPWPPLRPMVDGGHKVPQPGGGFGVYIEEQPEADALLRWSYGEWTEADRQHAREWKRVTKSVDLNRLARRYRPVLQPAESIESIRTTVDQVIDDPALQMHLLDLLLNEISPRTPTAKLIRSRWAPVGGVGWQDSTRYCRHVLRSILTFYIALGTGIVGTRGTNRIDLEYLFYLPFASIFVSGDDASHGRLAPMLLGPKQVYVRAQDYREALQEEVKRIAELRQSEDEPSLDALEPPEGSLIRELWMKTWGKFRPPPSSSKRSRPSTEGDGPDLIKKFQEGMDFVKAHPEKYPKRPPWPNL